MTCGEACFLPLRVSLDICDSAQFFAGIIVIFLLKVNVFEIFSAETIDKIIKKC